MTQTDSFESAVPDYKRHSEPVQLSLFLNLDGFEGPIDVLLTLARDQKVDLAKISILQLAEQYILFINQAQLLNLELAADYLVMAAWLAYLKSRLLLPEDENDDAPSSEEMAEVLRLQLLRLEAMQHAGETLMARPRLHQDFFPRGESQRIAVNRIPVFDVTLYDLLRAYGDFRIKSEHQTLKILATELFSVEDAISRLRSLLGHVPDWQTLVSFLPSAAAGPLTQRSMVAATFAATLQLAKDGDIHLRQDDNFGPIYLKSREEPNA